MVFYRFQLCAWVGDAIFFKKKHTSGFYANLCKKLKIQKPREWSNIKKRALVVLPVSRTVYLQRFIVIGRIPMELYQYFSSIQNLVIFNPATFLGGGFCLIILTIVALGVIFLQGHLEKIRN